MGLVYFLNELETRISLMNILKLQVLNGPNFWSNYRKKLIVLTLDLGHYEQLPTNLLGDFNLRLTQLIPSLAEHGCSYKTSGGFLKRLEEGTWLGHVIEHVALELQSLAGMDCGFGRTYGTDDEGVYQVIFSYEIADAGLYAARAAVALIERLASGGTYTNFDADIDALADLYAAERLGPSTQALVDEARQRGIAVAEFKDSSLISLGQGCHQKKIWAAVGAQTSSIAVDIASDKELTKNILEKSMIPVPKGITVDSAEELKNALDRLHFPVVIKPHNGNHGRGISTNVMSYEKALAGFELAQTVSSNVLVERHIKGDDYRFLVVNFRLVAVAKRTPALIVGTGLHTVEQLINKVNQDPQRGECHESNLTKIKVDDETLAILAENNLMLGSILDDGIILHLKGTANLSTGGTATDVTDKVHPDNVLMAERIARLINLDICGIDVVAESIQDSLVNGGGAVIEVNAGPGLRMHLHPSHGSKRNVAKPIIDMLYPEGNGSIPVVAVTGTNGKTTVVRLIAALAQKAKHHVGYATTEGVYSNGCLVYAGDCSGPASATAVLNDPLADFAVLECARGGILRSGLAFDHCDISVITNVTSDHLGLKGINTLEELAQVKAVVAFSTKKNGHAILNADDDLVYQLHEELQCQIALFARADNARIQKHCHDGGLACYVENSFIVVQQGSNKNYLVKITDIPLTFKGTATCMVQNILPAVLAGIISHFPVHHIIDALTQFEPTPEQLPGRMNLFQVKGHQVMLDYAHNEGAFIELHEFLTQSSYKRKVGIIGVAGDRRAEDLNKIGFLSAGMFDEIIIRHDKDGRGRTNDELTDFLMKGISTSAQKPQVHVISDEFDAVNYALHHTPADSFIFYTPEDVFKAINFLNHEKQVLKNTKFVAEVSIL